METIIIAILLGADIFLAGWIPATERAIRKLKTLLRDDNNDEEKTSEKENAEKIELVAEQLYKNRRDRIKDKQAAECSADADGRAEDN